MIRSVRINNIFRILFVGIVTIFLVLTLFKYELIDFSKVMQLGNEFQYNLLNFSSILAGFMFTGLGILLSAINMSRIERLWKHHYLDNLFFSAILEILFNVISMIGSLVILCCNITEEIKYIILKIEVFSMALSFSFFVYCLIRLISLILKMRTP